MDLDRLDIKKENLLIYAITHKKRHFLSLVKGNQELFQALPQRSILLDERFCRSYDPGSNYEAEKYIYGKRKLYF